LNTQNNIVKKFDENIPLAKFEQGSQASADKRVNHFAIWADELSTLTVFK
jgi:hypothetical protein